MIKSNPTTLSKIASQIKQTTSKKFENYNSIMARHISISNQVEDAHPSKCSHSNIEITHR